MRVWTTILGRVVSDSAFAEAQPASVGSVRAGFECPRPNAKRVSDLALRSERPKECRDRAFCGAGIGQLTD